MPKIIKPAKGTFTTADITVDSSGRVIAASSGSAGGGFNSTLFAKGPASGTYNGPGNGSMIQVYMTGGGGGNSPPNSRPGGHAGWGYYQTNISQPYSTPYSIGGQGAAGGGPTGGVGGGGGATTMAGVTANAGGGATPTNTGNTGTFTNATVDFGDISGTTGSEGPIYAYGNAQTPGAIWVWEA